MASVTGRDSALEKFLRLPEVYPPLEFYSGRITQKMSPKLVHTYIQDDLIFSLNTNCRPLKMGRACGELRVVFGGITMVPDISYFPEERMPDASSRVDRENVRFAPDLVVEIVSPKQGVGELRKKIRAALRGGVKLGWLIDEANLQVLVIRRGKKAKTLKVGETLSGEEILPGYALPTRELFSWVGHP